MTRMEGIRQAARVLSLTRPDTAAELEAAQILKAKLLRCVLSLTDLQEHRVALLALNLSMMSLKMTGKTKRAIGGMMGLVPFCGIFALALGVGLAQFSVPVLILLGIIAYFVVGITLSNATD